MVVWKIRLRAGAGAGGGRPSSVLHPFRAHTQLHVDLSEAGESEVGVLDITGRLLRSCRGQGRIGANAVTWDGTDGAGRHVGTGVFFYRVRVGDSHETRKMTLLR